jgi:predicted Zn-dependent protease
MIRAPMPPSPSLTPATDALELLSSAVAASPADGTALALVETVRATAGGRGARAPRLERQVLARVVEAERPGAFRALGTARHELAEAIRHAMARARAAERRPGGVPLLPSPRPAGGETPAGPELHDPRLAALEGEAAQSRLRALLRADEAGRLTWWEVGLTVVGSGGVARHLRATGVALEVRGRGGAHGHAAGAARTLQALGAEAIVERARQRAGTEAANGDGGEPAAVVLSAEAAAALVTALAPLALSAAAWEDPLAYPARHGGARSFAAELDLVEDAARSPGLPFPLGLAGGERATAALVAGGILRGPVADPFEAEALGVPATSPFWIGEPGAPEHLHLVPGEASEDELLRAAGDGVFVGEIERVACYDRGSLAARIATRGRRRIEGGALGGTLPPAVWEVELPAALGTVLALGRDTATLPEGPFGGVTAPGIALRAAGAWLGAASHP